MNTMTIDEEEIYLPNTTKYLDQLRINHAQQRCVLEGGEGEYDPLPVSPDKFSRSKLMLKDDVKVIRGPRERARMMNAVARRDDDAEDEVSFDVKVIGRDQDDSSLVSGIQDDSESIMRWRKDPLLRKNKYSFWENGESAAADSILNKIKLRRQERENERRLRELAEIDPESSSEDDDNEDDESLPQVKSVDQVVSDLSFESVREKEEASSKKRKAIKNRLPCGLMSLLLDDDEMKEMKEMGRISSPRMAVTSPCGGDNTDDFDEMHDVGRFAWPKTMTSRSGDGNDDNVEKVQIVERVAGSKSTVASPSSGGNHDAVDKKQEVGRFALPKPTVTSPSGDGNHDDDDVDKMPEVGRFAWLKATLTSHCGANTDNPMASCSTANGDGMESDKEQNGLAWLKATLTSHCGANNTNGLMASCSTANGDGTKSDKEQKGLSCAETNNEKESNCISAIRQQVEARDDFSPMRLLCGAGDASTSGGIDGVVKKDTDPSGGQWIDTVKKVVTKETKPAMPWLDTVSSSDSGVEEKEEGSKVASAMKAQCTNFASMLLIGEEEIVELKKYSCW